MQSILHLIRRVPRHLPLKGKANGNDAMRVPTQAHSKDLAEQKLSETRRKGMRAPMVYIPYSEVSARPDNEVRKPLARRGFRSGNLCPRD